MTDNDQVLKKAGEILEKFHVPKLIVDLIEYSYRYKSTSAVEYSCGTNGRPELKVGASVKKDGHEILVGLSDFEMSHAPDSDCTWGDAFVFFDGILVLQVTATKRYYEWENKISVGAYPSAIDAFLAGPWLELLGECREILQADYERREEVERQEKAANQVSQIDLGKYK